MNAIVRNVPTRSERQRLGAVGFLDRDGADEHDDGEGDQDEADRAELALEVCPGAFLDREGDLLHLRCARVGGEDALDQIEADGEGQQRRRSRSDQDQPLAASKLELLPTAFGGENRYVHLSSWSRDRDDVPPLVPRLAAPRGPWLDASAARAAGTLAVVRTDGTNDPHRRSHARRHTHLPNVMTGARFGLAAHDATPWNSSAPSWLRSASCSLPSWATRPSSWRSTSGRAYPLRVVVVGLALGYAAAGAVAALVGGLLGAALPDRPLAIGGGIVFLVFAVLSLRERRG